MLLTLNLEPSPCLLSWLNYTESLTKRLRAQAQSVRLEVLQQGWQEADCWAEQIKEPFFQREILMHTEKNCCWYARTLIPKTSYLVENTLFLRLNKESLGDIIFNDPKVKRVQLKHYVVDEQCLEYHWVKKWRNDLPKQLWLRYSQFVINHVSPFYLVEILFPELEDYCQ
jgi:chorismate--pyruvate lyase